MINAVVLMGRLVADPELKTTNTGVSVTTFRIAVDRSYVKAGAEREADFFDVVARRGTAEFVCRNFSKGSLIALDGQLQSRQFQTKEGQNRTVVEVVADNISFTGERRNAAEFAANGAVSNDNGQGGNFTPNNQNGVQRQNSRVYPQSGQAPQQYPQNYGGAEYDPRNRQGQFAPGGYTSDDDLPWR